MPFNYPLPRGYSELYRGLIYYNVDYVKLVRILARVDGGELIIESISQSGYNSIERIIINDKGISVHILEAHGDYVKESHDAGELTPLMHAVYVLVRALAPSLRFTERSGKCRRIGAREVCVGDVVLIRMNSGGRLQGRVVDVEGDTIVITNRVGNEVVVKLNEVEAIEFISRDQ